MHLSNPHAKPRKFQIIGLFCRWKDRPTFPSLCLIDRGLSPSQELGAQLITGVMTQWFSTGLVASSGEYLAMPGDLSGYLDWHGGCSCHLMGRGSGGC